MMMINNSSPSNEVIAAVILVVLIVQVLILIFGKELGLSFGTLAKCRKAPSPDPVMLGSPSLMKVYTLFLYPSRSRSMTSQGGIALVLTLTPDSIDLESDIKSGRISHMMLQGTILKIVTTSRTKLNEEDKEEEDVLVVSVSPFEPVIHVGKTAYTNVPIPASSGVPSVIVTAPLTPSAPTTTTICIVLGWQWVPN